jgi:hypothetical protein
MTTRLSKTVLAAAAIAAFAVPVGAQAKQGADDPAGHVRHAPHQTAAAPAASPAAKKSTASTSRSRSRHRGQHGNHGHRYGRHHTRRADDRTQVRGRGADDATTERRGRGTDDGPNHN